jgi:cell division protein FtsQ
MRSRPQLWRPLAHGRQLWVLHRRLLVRIAAAAIVCTVGAGVLHLRGPIAMSAASLGEMVQNEFADAGFAIAAIEISGQTLASEAAIFEALGLSPGISTLNFDPDAARSRLLDLPAISDVTIRKIYPDRVTVSVVEKLPVARWRVDGVTFVVDATGEQIGEDGGAYSDLPLVIGDGAADDALVMIGALERHPALKEGLVALSRIGDRRWDMIYDSGLRVQLPESGVAQALDRIEVYQNSFSLLDRDVSLIDLRVPGLIALQPVVRAESEEGDDS